ncbi:hypothetical protein L1049_023455 [Liquidambar formosana]|uniref:Omega-hydroxypalmitate O-feruloyl transferase n=1 Tax=Liquidambar formosana TaxID=63359 RepID=A0AAP0S023_LIQFO
MEGTCDKREITCIKKSEPVLIQPAEMEPHGDQFYFLSNLDQNFNGAIRSLYCFKLDDKECGQPVCDVIKQALAKVLVHYYPLMGSLTRGSDGKLIVKCTNQGVPFVEAFANDDLEVLGDITIPDPAMIGNLLYTIPGAKSVLEMPLLTVQVTRFKCGGFVLGMTINHCMVDAISAKEFVNSWAETARGISLTIPPFLDRSILRSRQPPEVKYCHHEFMDIEDISNISGLYQEGQMLYESFHFDSEMLARLKKSAMEDGVISSCTNFTVLAAFVWRARSKALNMKPHQQTKLFFAVDGRSKLINPPLPKGYFGNGIVQTSCICTAGELIEKPFSFAVELVENAKKKVTEDYIWSTIDFFEVTRAGPSLDGTLLITSWTGIPFDTVDFGWGEPTQFRGIVWNKETVLFIPSKKEKGGITLRLTLPLTAMNNFQQLIDTSLIFHWSESKKMSNVRLIAKL